MPAFFAHARGSVKRMDGPWGPAMPFRLAFDGRPNLAAKSIVTQVGLNQEGNFQFLHTLNDTIFVYVFGDRISEITVSGVAFGADCDLGGHGLTSTLDVYDSNKISKLGGPVTIGYGDRAFRAFLTGMRQDIVDAENMLGQFAFRFHCFPSRAVRS